MSYNTVMRQTITQTYSDRDRFLFIQEPYFYDDSGLRISRTDNLTGLTTYYVWETENPTGYPQVIEEIENGQVVRRYGYGHFLENVDIWNGTSFERFYVVRDGTNSVRIVLDSLGNVTDTIDYDAFGNIINRTGTTNISNLFHSEYLDSKTNLIYLRSRWYNPEDGRFLSGDKHNGDNEDPGSLNKYGFTQNNPVNLIDPSGMFGIDSAIRWGKRIILLLMGIKGEGKLKVDSIIEQNYDKGGFSGVKGKQKLTWQSILSRYKSTTINDVKWAEKSINGSYDYPAPPGNFRIVRTKPSPRMGYTIGITSLDDTSEKPEEGLYLHQGYWSKGCVVFGLGDKIADKILKEINILLNEKALLEIELKVQDNRSPEDWWKRPLPYRYEIL